MDQGWPKTASPFHPGEQAVQTRLGVRDKIEALGRQFIRDYLPEQHREFYPLLPFLVVGMTDSQGYPWVSLLMGPPGFISSPDAHELHMATQPLFGSPLAELLQVGADVGILGILPENRRRNRLTGTISAVDDEGITVSIAQTFGNCPQYIQTRNIELLPEISLPQQDKEIQGGVRLDNQARALIERSDTLFISTAYGPQREDSTLKNPALGADVSHRGGKPGFVRVEDDQTLIFPDFTGNFLFNTVGNIMAHPKAGFLFIDYDSRDLLYITGRAEIVWDGEEVEAFVGAERFIRCEVHSWRRVAASLPLKFQFGEYSPILEYSGSWEQMDATLAAKRERNSYVGYKVFKVEAASETISSFYLRRADGKSLANFEPGQFLPIRLTIPGEATPVCRVYSLSNAPYGDYYRLSVKREGLASNFLHGQIKAGDYLEAMAPRGKFTLDSSSDRPVVLLSAGVGITPMISMATFIVEASIRNRSNRSRRIYFIHGARNSKFHAFRETIHQLVEQYPAFHLHVCYSHPLAIDRLGLDYDSEGRVNVEVLKHVLPFDDFDFYLCGPQEFMRLLYDELREMGVRTERIHYESFGPATVLQGEASTSVTSPLSTMAVDPVNVYFTQSNLNTEWRPSNGTLLELAEANGLEPAFSCRTGICGICATRIKCGKVHYTEEPTAHLNEGEVLICCSTPRAISNKESCGDDIGIVLDL
ncbi:MAG: pyridoxamine 5'-phosphate oxidase family protein [Cyanobacteria bacterium P01_H01_bin.15]